MLEVLGEQEPHSDFTFCLGSDTFLDLTDWKWKRSRDVLKLLGGRLIVLQRKGTSHHHRSKELQDRINHINATESASVAMLDVPALEDVSSTVVRSCSDESKLQDMVESDVLEYMKNNQLYGFSSIAKNEQDSA